MFILKFFLFSLVCVFCVSRATASCTSDLEVTNAIELSETEVKWFISNLSLLPSDMLTALRTGHAHPMILRRGLVVQEYLPVSKSNLSMFFSKLNKAQIPFGTSEQQAAFLEDGVAKEIRMMSKSIRIGSRTKLILQATIKGAGGLSVTQIESPENLSSEKLELLKGIFVAMRTQVSSVARKVYFEPWATDNNGRFAVRPDGEPYSVEIDLFMGPRYEDGLIFANGEIEFHGTSQEAAIQAARDWSQDPGLRPSYFSRDLTEITGVKSRDIASKGAPPWAQEAMQSSVNQEIFAALLREFLSWSDPFVIRLMEGRSNFL